MDLDYERIRMGLISYLIVIGSLTLHEWGHAVTADNLGDPTARNMGRVTINPLAHIDLVGTVLLPLLGIFSGFSIIGWAKPVYINTDNLPKTSDRAWVTIAGPGMNLLVGVVAIVVGTALVHQAPSLYPLSRQIMIINVSLMVFNLLPIPPLDGSKFLMYWFGMSELTYAQFSRFGWIILMVAFNIPQSRTALAYLIQQCIIPFDTIASLVA